MSVFTVATHYARPHNCWLTRAAWTTMIKPPPWALNADRNLADLFAPTERIVFGGVTRDEYVRVYRDLMRARLPALDAWLAAHAHEHVHLLCACPEGQFCHRHLIAKLLIWRGWQQVPLAPLRLAVVGSRGYPALARVVSYVRRLPLDTIVLSGGALGVDRTAEHAAQARGMVVESYHPDYANAPDPLRAPLVRNTALIAAATHVTAFWDETSNGTRDALSKAIRRGISVTLFGREGKRLSLASLAMRG